jgi:ankyrin repeat protein
MNEEEFFNALRNSDLEKVKDFLVKGGDINKQDKDGYTPLMIVCLNYQRISDTISKASTNSNVNYKQGYNTYNTIITNNKLIADILLEKGADVNIKSKNGFTCLMICSTKNYLSMAESLTNKPFNKEYLLTNIYYNNLDIVKNIIKAGADVNIKDSNKLIALHYASKSNNIEIALEVINANSDINSKDSYNITPLIYSIMYNSKDVFDLLMKLDVDVNVLSNSGTALYNAVIKNNIDFVEALIKKGADVNRGNFDEAPIIRATINNYKDILELLINNGANLDVKSGDFKYLGYTPLLFAILYQDVDNVKLLIDKGADIYVKTSTYLTIYDFAAHVKNKEIDDIISKIKTDPMYKRKQLQKRLNQINIKQINYFKHKNTDLTDLQEKAQALWIKREKDGYGGPVCDLEGFYQHHGECGNDAFQMLLISSDKVKETIQKQLIYNNYDEVDFDKYITDENVKNISAPILLKTYIQAFQSRFIRHYLNEEMFCTLDEKEVRSKLYRSRGFYSKKSQLSLHYGVYDAEPPTSIKNYYTSNRYTGTKYEKIFPIYRSIFSIFNIEVSKLDYLKIQDITKINIDTVHSMLLIVEAGSSVHAMCLYECGKKQFLFEDNKGPIRFEWRLLLNLYKQLLLQDRIVQMVFKEKFNVYLYPCIYLVTEAKLIYIDPTTYKITVSEYDAYNYTRQFVLKYFTPITFTSGITENTNIKEINEPQRRRLSNIPTAPIGTPLPKMNEPILQNILSKKVKGGKRKTKKVIHKNRKTKRKCLSKRVK